jgi:serine/threonine protein kinase
MTSVKPLPAPDRWRIIQPLLEQALELPPERRGPFLDQACGQDARLRAEIDNLLQADSDAGAFLDAPVDLSAIALEAGEETDSAWDPTAPGGTSIGPYRVLREIGRGGMGVVYEAQQERPRRPVALKVILGGRHVDATTIRMFQREADSLARLKHPGIAAIYESGSTDEGQHFFAMELVQGRPLSDYLAEKGAATSRAEVRGRLALFRKICSAVAYAHQRGVIHQDLKPSNILVVERPAQPDSTPSGSDLDMAPDIKVLDFGLARIADPEAEAATAVTVVGRIQGTLPYMSPEQVRGRRDELDVRTDVYSLGVILYRALTGQPPYDLEGVDFAEAARIVCDQAPRPLGAAAGGTYRFDHDLSIIVLKALEKEAARRYPTVAALDEDLARYLGGQPILARPPSALYQMRKLMSRHKVPFAAAGVILLAILGSAIVATVQAERIAAERDRANRETKTARRVSEFLTGLFKVSDPDEARGNAITAREILDKGTETIGKELAGEPEVLARLMLTMGTVYGNLGLYKTALPIVEKSVETERRILGEDNLETLAAMHTLATLYTNLARYPEAEKLYAQVIEARRRLEGEEHPDTLSAMAALAFVEQILGRYSDAEKVYGRLLEVRRRTLGDDHPDTLTSMASLANVYRAQRRYAEAEALFVPAIQGLRRVLGEDNSTTLRNIGLLANVYERQERYAEAEKLHRESVDRLRRLLGDDHPRTLEAQNELAVLFDDEGRNAEAEKLYIDTLERRRRVLGLDHPSTLSSMNNLANIYAVEGRHAEAEALFLESLGRVRRVLGENHPDVTNTLYNLGCLASLRGDRKGALDWLDQAVTHGYSHWDVMAKDSDLKRLHGPAFDAIVARARKNAG